MLHLKLPVWDDNLIPEGSITASPTAKCYDVKCIVLVEDC